MWTARFLGARARGAMNGGQRLKVTLTFASCSIIRTSMWGHLRRQIIGMRWGRFGRFKPAKMFISKSQSVTTFGKGERLLKQRASMGKLSKQERSRAQATVSPKGLRGCMRGTLVKFSARAASVTSAAPASAKWMVHNQFRPRLI